MEERTSEGVVYYHITVVSQLLDLSAQTILRYERLGLIRCAPGVWGGPDQERCYDAKALARLKRIKWLTADLGVNLAGVEVILQLLDRMDRMQP